MNKKYEKLYYTDPHSVDIHELAGLTPMQTDIDYQALLESIRDYGQLQPVVMYKGKLVDGRHRLKALKELNTNSICYINMVATLTLEEVKDLVMKGYENRRHQTATQKAIGAYRNYKDLIQKGEKQSMATVAKQFGSTRLLMDRVRQVSEYASDDVVDSLWNGNKLIINGKPTESLLTVINYYKTISDEIVAGTSNTDLTDAELEFISITAQELRDTYNNQIIRALAKQLYVLSE